MNVNFQLKRPGEKKTSIRAEIYYSNNRIVIYTGISVLPKYWNKGTQKVKQSPSYREGSSINTRLDKIRSNILKCYYSYLNEHDNGTDEPLEPSPAALKKLINEMMGRSKETKLNFFEYFEDFILRTNSGQRRNSRGKIIRPSKAYKVTFNNLKGFNPKLDFDNIDLDFYEDYLKHLQGRGLSENTIGREIKNLKAVLNDSVERGFNKNLAFRSKRFSKPSEEVDNIALTKDELQDLQALDLSKNPSLERVRDLFLIGCHTGLRFSDFSRLTTDNIKGDFIEITQSKTGQPVAIPVHKVVKSILKKYDGKLPRALSNQKMNAALKIICKQVELLREKVSKTGTKGGLKVTINCERWKLVSTHTARRTFATNAYLQGVPTVSVMSVTGHRSEKNFLKYIRVTPRQHAKIMAGIWNRNEMKIVEK